jgi:hypothetical protein
MTIIDRYDPQAFVTVEEPKILRGGRVAAREWAVAPLSKMVAMGRSRG